MMLVGFKFCVVFFSTVGGVIAIFNDTVAVSAVFAIKFDTIAILRAGGHMLRTDPICNYLVGDNIHVLWLLIMMMTNHLIVALLWIFQFSVFPPSHVRLCKVKVKNGKDLVALHLNWYKRLEIIVPYILQTYTNLYFSLKIWTHLVIEVGEENKEGDHVGDAWVLNVRKNCCQMFSKWNFHLQNNPHLHPHREVAANPDGVETHYQRSNKLNHLCR